MIKLTISQIIEIISKAIFYGSIIMMSYKYYAKDIVPDNYDVIMAIIVAIAIDSAFNRNRKIKK